MYTTIPPELTQLIGNYLEPKIPKYTAVEFVRNNFHFQGIKLHTFNTLNDAIEYAKRHATFRASLYLS